LDEIVKITQYLAILGFTDYIIEMNSGFRYEKFYAQELLDIFFKKTSMKPCGITPNQ